MNPQEAQLASQRACQRLVPLVPPGAIVAGYVPFRGELDVTAALLQLAERGHSLCLPVIESAEKPLYFRRWRP
ncbi:MAG: 5-formyltetrahydrofolate cyclo-ligase, partial [Proteobacteria bacterium]|nr:5-formyltetrahydrofolate cyclo-ligase [Pseudomonadota bacterium]